MWRYPAAGLAEAVESRVSVVYSSGGPAPAHQQELCTASGGICIEFENSEADSIVELLSTSVESSKAMINQLKKSSADRRRTSCR